MPIARFQLEDGRVARFEVPEGTSPEQAQSMMTEHFTGQPTQSLAPQTLRGAPKSLKDELMAQSFPKEQNKVVESLPRGALDVLDTIGSQIVGRATGNKEFVQQEAKRQSEEWKVKNPELSADVGRILGGAAVTYPVGGIFGKIAEGLRAAPSLIQALRTSGMTTGATPMTGLAKAGDLALRTGAAGAVGGASGALINPEDAGTSALVGAAMPSIIKGAGAVGEAIGKNAASKYDAALSKFNREAPKRETLKEAVDAGYVVPPNMVNPSVKNALIESFSGKQATSQIASVKNQDVTEKLVRQALGIAEDAPLTKGALEQIRKVEGGAYKKVSELSPAAEYDLEALKQARNEAQGWFNAYNRSASPEDLAKAKGFRDTAEMLELRLESHAKDAGKDELIPALRDARKQIAKTYTVERALNDATGSVNAKVLGRMFEKQKPLSDGLDVVGRFASGFDKVNQSAQQMGSPAAHNLRSIASMLAGGGGYAALGPVGAAAATIPFIAPMASRGLMFRRGAQEALANPQAPTIANAKILAELLQNQKAQEAIARTAPLAVTSR